MKSHLDSGETVAQSHNNDPPLTRYAPGPAPMGYQLENLNLRAAPGGPLEGPPLVGETLSANAR